MIIEFNNTMRQLNEWVIVYIKDRLTELYQRNKEILRARINFKRSTVKEVNKVCEIEITIQGNTFLVYCDAASYEQAAEEAIAELSDKIAIHSSKQKELPNEYTDEIGK